MIRSVTKNDYEEIAKLMVEAFKNPPWNEVWSYERSYQRIEQLDDGKYTRCFVYMLDNKIAGVVCGKLITYVNDLDFMIEDFYIDPHCQRRGLGKNPLRGKRPR
ncbi:MAG: GNAT family N-acetyltransferase, partial [Thomasclavelia ramosa]|nr:GNAT family N-acetyltransferase [Thomasclavelia ramosa]